MNKPIALPIHLDPDMTIVNLISTSPENDSEKKRMSDDSGYLFMSISGSLEGKVSFIMQGLWSLKLILPVEKTMDFNKARYTWE